MIRNKAQNLFLILFCVISLPGSHCRKHRTLTKIHYRYEIYVYKCHLVNTPTIILFLDIIPPQHNLILIQLPFLFVMYIQLDVFFNQTLLKISFKTNNQISDHSVVFIKCGILMDKKNNKKILVFHNTSQKSTIFQHKIYRNLSLKLISLVQPELYKIFTFPLSQHKFYGLD